MAAWGLMVEKAFLEMTDDDIDISSNKWFD